MRYLFAGLFVVSGAAFVGGAPPDRRPGLPERPGLRQARQRWLRGNYEEARSLYETLTRDQPQEVVAAVGLSRAWQSQGEYDKGLVVLDGAVGLHPRAAELHAARAELLYLRGRWPEAQQAAEKALEEKPDHFLARWVRAQVHRDRGNLQEADSEFRWFIRSYSERSDKDNDIKDCGDLLLVALAGAENARWHHLSDQFRIILTDVLAEAVNQDKDFWPAECLAGMLLLEKYNRAGAQEAFDRALAINPNAAEAFVGKGMAALQRYELADAERFANRALKLNPNLPAAHRLHADIQLAAGDIRNAERELQEARKINPRDEETVGRLAACFYLRADKSDFQALCREVSQHDPHPAVFYHALAAQLEEGKRFQAAEEFYKKAIGEHPELPWSHSGLGLLYMRLGREKEAKAVLEEAFKADEFNVRVANTLKVLRHLEKYQSLATKHFVFRFDPQTDKRQAAYMAPYLEEVYRELAARFRYEPPGPILVEIFNNHEMFSGRTIALPDLHTIGASTGRVIAMVSPHGEGIRRPFNWARVVRHELVHIFNLGQTDFRVPHWLTEGLAVAEEGFPRSEQWLRLLRQHRDDGTLLALDTIDTAFIRPRSALEWHLAYAQAQLYVEYMNRKYGSNTALTMLLAFQAGLDTPAAVARTCHVDLTTFEKAYREVVGEVLRDSGEPAVEKEIAYGELQRACKTHPDDVDLLARLAEQQLIRRDKAGAGKLADLVLQKQKGQTIACYVKARLLLDAGQDEQARSLLERALSRVSPDSRILFALGKLYYESRDYAKAAEIYELAHKARPCETSWLVELQRVYTEAGDISRQIDVLKKLVRFDPDDFNRRKRLTRLLVDADRHAEAEQYARELLHIDVRDAEACDILERSLAAQNKNEELARFRRAFR
jgi:tetratricopeptide (TPR) repeat protein